MPAERYRGREQAIDDFYAIHDEGNQERQEDIYAAKADVPTFEDLPTIEADGEPRQHQDQPGGETGLDLEGDLRGNAPAIDVYSGEFIAADADQLALADKRAVMDQISGRVPPMGPFTEQTSAALHHLAEVRDQFKDTGEADSSDDWSFDNAGMYPNELSDADQPVVAATAAEVDGDMAGEGSLSDEEDGDMAGEGSLSDLEDGDSAGEESPSEWRARDARQQGRSGHSLGGHRDGQAAQARRWQAAEPRIDEESGIASGTRRARN